MNDFMIYVLLAVMGTMNILVFTHSNKAKVESVDGVKPLPTPEPGSTEGAPQ